MTLNSIPLLYVQGNITFDDKEVAKLLTAFRAQRMKECGDDYIVTKEGVAEIQRFKHKLLFMNLCLKCFRMELKAGVRKHALTLLFERFKLR